MVEEHVTPAANTQASNDPTTFVPPRRWLRAIPPLRIRVGLGLADQALSSVTNFGGTVVAARMLSPGDLGHFAAVGAVYVVALAIARGMINEPVVLGHSQGSSKTRRELQVAAAAMLVLGSALAVLIASAAFATTGDIRRGLLLLAALLPALLFQDFARFVAMTLRSPARAVALDALWLGLQVVAVVAVETSGRRTSTFALGAWLAPGALSGVAGFALFRIRPMASGLAAWVSRNSALGYRFAIDNLLGQNTGVVLLFVLAVVSNSDQVAYFRVAQTAFGPLVVVSAGIRLAIVPELVRVRDNDPVGFRRLIRRLGFALTATAMCWAVALRLVPSSFGQALFGASWSDAQRLILPVGVSVAAGGITTAAYIGIRAYADARGSLRTITRVSITNVLAGTLGAALGGSMGAALALAVSVPFTAILWVRQLRRSRDAYTANALNVNGATAIDRSSEGTPIEGFADVSVMTDASALAG